MNIINIYFKYYNKYTEIYGHNTIILMKLGWFYEIIGNCYGIFRTIDLDKLSSILNHEVIKLKKFDTISLPFKEIDKCIKTLIDNKYNVIVIENIETDKGISIKHFPWKYYKDISIKIDEDSINFNDINLDDIDLNKINLTINL